MIAQEVAKKYARALLMSTKERGVIDQAYDQFSGLSKVLEGDRSLLTFLSSPSVDEEQKLQLVRKVFKEQLEELFIEFLAVLVRKRRAGYLPEVLDEFNRLVEFEKGINRVTVFTAVPLQDAEEATLVSKLIARSGGTLELEKKVDSSLLGGMIVIMHDQIVDGSVKHGMSQIEEMLQKVKVH